MSQTDPIAPGYSLAQLVRPARNYRDKPRVVAERYIRHGATNAHDTAIACFKQWGLMRKGLAVRCLPVTVRDLGMQPIS